MANKIKEDLNSSIETAKETIQNFSDKTRKTFVELKQYSIKDLVYITPRIINLSFPISDRNAFMIGTNREILLRRFLDEHHKDHYLVINISDEHYDSFIFNNNVIEVFFPGYSSPPIGYLFRICWIIENWLNSDINNIIVLHCRVIFILSMKNGKGRSIVSLSCFLAWSNQLPTAKCSAEYILEKKGLDKSTLIPSQWRYIYYFDDILMGNKFSITPLTLKTIKIVGKIKSLLFIGAPYFELIQGDQIHIIEGLDMFNYEFNQPVYLQGNIQIRWRTLFDKKEVKSIFRYGFHTGFLSANKLTAGLAELDGPYSEDSISYSDSFSIELEFERYEGPIDTLPIDTYEKALQENPHFWKDVTIRSQKKTEYPLKSSKGNKRLKIELSEMLFPNLPERKNYLHEMEELELELGLHICNPTPADNEIPEQISTENNQPPTIPVNELDGYLDGVLKDIDDLDLDSSDDSDIDIQLDESDEEIIFKQNQKDDTE